MPFTKITSEDLADKGVVGLPDTPNLSVTALQQKFDEIANDVIVPKFNNLVDELDSYEETVNITERVKSSEITNIRTDEDENLQISRDNGKTWSATASSGHIIEDGAGTPYPSRGRMQFSSNVNIFDEPEDNRTFIQVQSGEKGDKGENATIRVGEVEESETAYVVNVGSDTDAIFDFGLPKGERGVAATIQVGTVTSGSAPSVSNRGTSSNAIFDFVLQKGDKGDAGTSFQVLGVYATIEDLTTAHPVGNKGDAYAVGDSVTNVIYNWDNDKREWVNLGGLKGVKGDDGNAATVTIGTVTTVENGEPATVVNDGTTTDAILSFGIPKGAKGDQGNSATISVGNVTKGDEPSFVNVGTSTNAIFDITLPKGDKGDPSVVNGKSGETIQLNGADILLTGYRRGQSGEVTSTDSINTAISKLATSSGGAKIVVSLDEESIGHTFTCKKGDIEYVTIATTTRIEFTVTDVGTWTITNVEAENSATVDVPYFGVYYVAVGTGNVIINVTYDSEYIGHTFTCTNGTKTKTFVGNSYLTGTFIFAELGTYTISNDLTEGTRVVEATEEKTYEVAFRYSAFGYEGWAESGGITKSYASIDELFADEIAIRKLMTLHASSDYLVDWYNADNTIIATFTGNEIAMKWIGLRDYICDKLMAIPEWKTAMFASENWKYILKETVPTMTSATTPYCTILSNSNHSTNPAYMAYDGNDATYGCASSTNMTSGTMYIEVVFPEPRKIEKAEFFGAGADTVAEDWNLWASNDDVNWVKLTDFPISRKESVGKQLVDLTCDGYYTRYSLSTENPSSNGGWYTIQLYGRKLGASVPTMTSNTTPSGEVIFGSEYGNGYSGYNAFNDTNWWASASNQYPSYIGYNFGKDVKVNTIVYQALSTVGSGYTLYDVNADIEYSDDGITWQKHKTVLLKGNTDVNYIDVDDVVAKQWRIKFANYNEKDGSNNYYNVASKVNFYGLDYSENLDVTILTAPNDTVYYVEDASPITLCVANELGVGLADISEIEGNVEICSTIAKSTTDESVPYSLSLNEALDSDEIKLYPKGAIYWYGREIYEGAIYENSRANYATCIIQKNTNSIYTSASRTGSTSGVIYYAEVMFNHQVEGGKVAKVNASRNDVIMAGSSASYVPTAVAQVKTAPYTVNNGEYLGVGVAVYGNNAKGEATVNALWLE